MKHGPCAVGIAASLVLAVLLGGCATAPLPPSVTAVPDLAAYREEYQRVASFNPGGSVHRIEWSGDGTMLTFNRGEERVAFDLHQRTFVPLPPPPPDVEEGAGEEERATPRRPRSRRRGPGRGRQYMSETSPDEQWIARCVDFNVILESADEDDETRIVVTTDGHQKFRYGTANWVYGEEIGVRHGMWWSADSRKLVFYEFDEREVEDFYLLCNWTGLRPELLVEGYTKAGEPNPKVELLIYDVESATTSRLGGPPAEAEDWYIFDVRLAPHGELLFTRADRLQHELHVVAVDLETLDSRIVVTEIQDTWQNNHPTMRFLEDGERFIWETERHGVRQYELRRLDDPDSVVVLTSDACLALSIVEVNEARQEFYYTAASGHHPLNAHLHRVNLDGTGAARLTSGPLSHSRFNISPDGKWFTARSETLTTPPSTALYDANGRRMATLAEADLTRIAELGYPAPELFSFTADDGKTVLYGSLFKPVGFNPWKQYPLLISVYGGPGSRAVRNRYRAADATTSMGYLVARIDNRGTSGRGKAFLGAVYRKLGIVDIQDQADGARYLAKRPYVDEHRIGIFGHSYGGYMSALAILKFPDVFDVAVAAASPTHWRHYDSIYTERYMGLPDDNEAGYTDGSCLPYAAQLRGDLLLQHGMVDDNVHPNNAWELIDALYEAGMTFDVMFHPESGHGLNPRATRDRWRYLHEHLIADP